MPIAEDPEPRPAEGRDPDGADPSGTGGKDPFADLVLDEEFVRGATVKEQAGRTRMLAARWKHTPPVDPGGRRSVNDGPRKAGRFRRKPQPLDARDDPRPRRRFEGRTALYVLLTVTVLLGALNVDAVKSWFTNGSEGSSPRGPVPTAAPETARPTAAPPKTAAQQPTVDHPWAGSPAEDWPTSIDVFGPKDPPPAIGAFTAEQVAAQVKLVKDYLAAANLDPKTVAGGRPEAALAMIERETRDELEAGLAHPTEENDPTGRFSRFDPREAIPVNDTVKIQGRITVDGDGDGGVVVHTDFTFVYALRPGPEAAQRAASPRPTASAGPGSPLPAPKDGTAKPVGLVVPAAGVAGDTWTARTIVRRVDDYRFHDPARYRNNPKKINFGSSKSESGNSACNVHDGYFHPQFEQFARPLPGQTGPATDPYDRNRELQGDGDCGTISRS
ncbi:hypothetical protein RMN57_17775 [Kitasatospora sp. CM 4170]|uniref:Uncharacterized protein n=1 Tax=Kitasatospora aburaviensis TaxID=67265 RepID=A0ABW1EZH2_9ACTN|nr:hypothetical protein [Kitasatospora sp. CM 4170]WNM46418.1 hypothetical protein RMN57_17775 [Kitasatospora sp. CM 4170]